MSIAIPLARIPVGVVVERRKSASRWVDFTWHPLMVLPGRPAAAPWSVLSHDLSATIFYAGSTEIELYRTETGNYRHNLESAIPSLWTVLRPAAGEPPLKVFAVTADPSEGESYTQAGSDLVEAVPMPEAIAQILTDFTVRHHVEQSFRKRKRDRAASEVMPGRKNADRDQA